MKTYNYFSKIIILLGASILINISSKAQNEKAIDAITIDELKNHMYFLASDFLGGRVSYQPGFKIAAEYCASQFKSAGLKPIIKDKEGKLTYFQEVPLLKQMLGKECSVSLVSSGKTIELEHVKDFKIVEQVKDFTKSETEIVFAGYGISEPGHKWDDFENIDITGKAVIIIMDAPKKNGKNVLPDKVHKSYQSVPGAQKKIMSIISKKPSSILFVADNELLKVMPWESLPSFAGGDQYSYDAIDGKEKGYQIPLLYVIHPNAVDKLFKNQKYSPKTIEKKGLKGYKTYAFKDLKLKSNFVLEKIETIIVRNVVAVLNGTDNMLKNEYVSLVAHLDHVLPVKGEICNGADDNASGSVGVMEVAESMVLNPPKRSVLFVLFTAEELGLIGSQHFVANPPVSKENIVFNLNLDMIGRSAGKNIETRAHEVTLHDKYFAEIKKYVEGVNAESINWPLVYKSASDSPGDSDHTSFHNAGIPNMHFFSGHHKDLHTPTDDAENIDYGKMQKIAQLTYIIVQKLANTEKKITFSELN